MEHHLRIEKCFADAVLAGDKNFDVLKNDRGFQKGDVIAYEVWDGPYRESSHKLNKTKFQITYVLNGWGIQEGYVAFGIKEVKPDW